jgi:hypothetical protein
MDFQEKQRQKRQEQLAADNQKRAEKRTAMQAPSEDNPPLSSGTSGSASPKIEVKTTKYVPTIPEYALKIEFGGHQTVAPIAAYNRFKLLNTPHIEHQSTIAENQSTIPETSILPDQREDESQ